jgi:hypothetical protein
MKAERAAIRDIGRRINSNTIEITVPVSVANDLKQISKVTATVLGRLGCEGCHSGYDLRFINESRFRFNEKLEQIDIPGRG